MGQNSRRNRVHLWPQLNHPGRQAFGSINREVVAPSAVPLKMGGASKMFKVATPLTEEAIWDIIKRFGNAARIMKEAGFTGCQIHGAHGYLVSQFLSPISNTRTDQWGGSLENRARFVLEVYREIRQQVGADYPVGIKINSADFPAWRFYRRRIHGSSTNSFKRRNRLDRNLWGTYEKPAMVKGNRKQSTLEREAYFLDYIKKARQITNKPLMLTGGFRSVKVMEEALAGGAMDIIGLGRPFCLYPI